MRKTLNKQAIIEILYGSAFMSTGAGGTLKTGLRMLAELERDVEISLELITADELREGELAAMTVGYGSPDAFLDTAFGMEAVYAFEGLQQLLSQEGRRVGALYSLEYAGFNSFTPMYVGIRTGIPILDVDCNEKAIPNFEKSLHTVRGGVTAPLVLGGGTGDVMIVKPKRENDFPIIERVIRQMCAIYGQKLAVATGVTDEKGIRRTTIPGAVTHAWEVGQALLAAKTALSGQATPTPEQSVACLEGHLRSVSPVVTLCAGTVVRLDKTAAASYNKGFAVVEEPGGRRCSVGFKNETLLVKEGEHVLVTVPDNICTYRLDDLEPITNSEITEGTRIGVCALPAPRVWWEEAGGFELYRDMLAEIGYEGGPVPMPHS